MLSFVGSHHCCIVYISTSFALLAAEYAQFEHNVAAQHKVCTDMKKSKSDKQDIRAAEANLKAMQDKLALMVRLD
jgi:hypothetical protein